MSVEKNDKWGHFYKIEAIGRFNELFIIINLTVFVFSGLVKGFRYYFPIFSLSLSLLIALIVLFPLSRLESKKTLWAIFIFLVLSVYFTLSSLVYFVEHNDFQLLRTIH